MVKRKRYRSSVALDWLARGLYQRVLSHSTGNTWTALTELSINSTVAASGQDKLFPWVRCKAWLQSDASDVFLEWMVVKKKTAEALPNIDDNSVVEQLKKEGKIFAHGIHHVQKKSLGPPPKIEYEFRNVRLIDGEELNFFIKTLDTVSDARHRVFLEYTESAITG